MIAQVNQSILWKPEKNASEESDVKDRVVTIHKNQYCHFVIPGLLSDQLSQCLSGKILSCSGVRIQLTEIVGKKNTYNMIDYLNQAGGCELSHIPGAILPLPVVFLYLWSQFICPNHLTTSEAKTSGAEYHMLIVISSTTTIPAFLQFYCQWYNRIGTPALSMIANLDSI